MASIGMARRHTIGQALENGGNVKLIRQKLERRKQHSRQTRASSVTSRALHPPSDLGGSGAARGGLLPDSSLYRFSLRLFVGRSMPSAWIMPTTLPSLRSTSQREGEVILAPLRRVACAAVRAARNRDHSNKDILTLISRDHML